MARSTSTRIKKTETPEEKYKTDITDRLKAMETYKSAYDAVIDELAQILVKRDCAYKEWMDSGGETCIYKTGRDGSTTLVKNPILDAWNTLNTQALAHWKELGLTPVSFKKIQGDAPKVKRGGGLAEALAKLEI